MLNNLLILFPKLIRRIRVEEKILFLTFDDGPVPEATPEVLSLLNDFGAKATFFCIGDNVKKHQKIFEDILSHGHAIGNHTFNHLNGWRTPLKTYLENVTKCDVLLAHSQKQTLLFRPPYGKITPSEYSSLKKVYRIVMWDVLARDWETERSADSCFKRIVKGAKPGSIVVFHDSIKAKPRMLPALQATLEHFGRLGYRFESLEKYV